MTVTYFCIVGTTDSPQFEYFYTKSNTVQSPTPNNLYLKQFITLQSLDILNELQFQSSQLYFKTIDKYKEMLVSAYLTHTGCRLIVVGESNNDYARFFTQVAELLRKLMMNPFWEQNQKITSSQFRQRVETLAIKYF